MDIRSHHFMANKRGEKVETVTDFYFLGLQDSDCSHEIKKCLLLERKALTILYSVKKQRHHFADKGPYSQSLVFLVVMYGCES